MSRASSPGGRFTTDYETIAISNGINVDLQRPAGTNVQWWKFDAQNTDVDPIYDVGSNYPDYNGGKRYRGPYNLPVIRAIITQGQTKTSQQGFYNADILHLTVNSTDMDNLIPGSIFNPDGIDRDRVIWLEQVWRPFQAQQKGVVSQGFVLLTIELTQVMPEELQYDMDFLSYSS